MRALVVHPGASWATHDVYVGLTEGLRAHSVEVSEFRLDTRIDRSHDFLHFLWRRQSRSDKEKRWPKPTYGDILHQAAIGLIERAIERNCTDVIVVSAMFLLPDRIELCRRAGLRVWLVCTETPYAMADELRLAKLVDGVWTHERAALDAFTSVNLQTGYLPHGWRKGVHNNRSVVSDYDADVIFVGSLFPERITWLEAIDWSGINFALYGNCDMLSPHSPLRKFVRGGVVPNITALSLAKRAKIALNLFREPEHGIVAESLNPRLYEMAAAGICQVSNWRAEVGEIFGNAVRVANSPAESSAAIRQLLCDDAERNRMAEAAAAMVAGASWNQRSKQIINDVQRWRASAA